jgi:deoxyribodipyrimidine photo-lyase
VEVVSVDHPTLVAPGTVLTDDGQPYRVFTPYFRKWRTHLSDATVALSHLDPYGPGVKDPLPWREEELKIEAIGEVAALERWRGFRDSALESYSSQRDLPGVSGTSRLSWALHLGVIHPRTLLSDLADDHDVFLSELCWRDFYAEVLMRNPTSVTAPLDQRFVHMVWDEGSEADARFEAWKAGRTGYPIVDAGMRQLQEEHWMHNRVRMITASFLIKDLHIHWARGAAYFLEMLEDGDVASNTHGWQWVAGCGTDASPYFRIFNPIRQGERFDPDGTYVRRYVPELSDCAGASVHQPKSRGTTSLFESSSGGSTLEYPSPIVDHADERAESLRRFEEMKRRAAQAG